MNRNQEKFSKNSLESLIGHLRGVATSANCSGLFGSGRAFAVSRIYKELKIPLVIIASSQAESEKFMDDLGFFLNTASDVSFFPAYDLLPIKYHTSNRVSAGKRINALYRLLAGESRIVVTTADALARKTLPKTMLRKYAELVMGGEEIDTDYLVEKLVAGGYSRSILVEEPGDFSVRGGIIDIYCPLYPDPVRLELFGDTVESVRFFSAQTQRTTGMLPEAIILPARETIMDKDGADRTINEIRLCASNLDIPALKIREVIDGIKRDDFSGVGEFLHLVYPEPGTLFDYIPETSLFILVEPKELEMAVSEARELARDRFEKALSESRLCAGPDDLCLDWAMMSDRLSKSRTLSIRALPITEMKTSEVSKNQLPLPNDLIGDGDGLGHAGKQFGNLGTPCFDFQVESNTELATELKNNPNEETLPLVDRIQSHTDSRLSVIFVCGSGFQADRLQALLAPYGIRPEPRNGFPGVLRSDGRTMMTVGTLSSGFVWPGESLAVITDAEIFGAKKRAKKAPKAGVHTELLAFSDLKSGDLVVHAEHGIGRYEGLVKLRLNGAHSDFLFLTYKGDDKLYLPVDRMSMIQKYLGVDGVVPMLDKMGGNTWDRTKKKVRASVEKIAGELLKIYAERKVKKGYAFRLIGDDLRQFEADFPYEETPDQMKAIDDVINDMALATPMDRLICGDVGYGKTEVALRASFLAVCEGKQVAFLVPTTVLAQQHYATFQDRFKNFPIQIACLSRFRSPKEQREIVRNLKEGKLDIVIGTHRLLQKDVVFKDIGLVVLDEEHRFGVKHKENLKKMKSTVDVLTLTATPIPRTLHMSMMGIRDISVISTPPEHRRSISTYICEFDEAIMTRAIRNELERKGQIFFVHNNIKSIWAMARYLQKIVPEVRLGVAHGRMAEEELEKAMLSFMNRDIDMLVCTTIIESGLDIPSANTILVNRADRFGLAQIYQLRGRVGRADEQAFAYLFIPNEAALGKDAQKRLKVLMDHSDLGSGFKIAMSDLKIRGGGTILGASQSGHIASVGYDMFLSLMENAISEIRGEPVTENLDPEINAPMSAFIPETYIPDIDQRLAAYRRLSKMDDLGEISEFKKELIDRYGVLPEEAANMLLKIMLKVMSKKAGVKKLDLSENRVFLHFSQTHQKNPLAIVHMITAEKDPGRFMLTQDNALSVKLAKAGPNGNLLQCKNILKEISRHVNG